MNKIVLKYIYFRVLKSELKHFFYLERVTFWGVANMVLPISINVPARSPARGVSHV